MAPLACLQSVMDLAGIDLLDGMMKILNYLKN